MYEDCGFLLRFPSAVSWVWFSFQRAFALTHRRYCNESGMNLIFVSPNKQSGFSLAVWFPSFVFRMPASLLLFRSLSVTLSTTFTTTTTFRPPCDSACYPLHGMVMKWPAAAVVRGTWAAAAAAHTSSRSTLLSRCMMILRPSLLECFLFC